MRRTLRIKFQYIGNLAKPSEHTPIIYWSSSLQRDSRIGVVRKKLIRWENELEQISKIEEIVLDLNEKKNKIPADATIYLEVLAHTANHEGFQVPIRAGNCHLLLRDIYNVVSKMKKYDDLSILEMQQMMIELEENKKVAFVPNVKGKVKIIFDESDQLNEINSWSFSDVKTYDVVPENMTFLYSLINDYILRTQYPFMEEAKVSGMKLEPCVERFGNIMSPPWINSVSLPDLYYWVYYSEGTITEEAMLNLARIGLKRRKIEEMKLIEIIDQQFHPDTKEYTCDFSDAIAVIITTLCLLSISLRYTSDVGFARLTNGTQTKILKEMIESFNDALRVGAGDCEDLGCLIYRIYFFLKLGNPKLRDSQKEWRQLGGWESPLLDRMQKVLHLYVGFGCLGSVTGAKLSDDKKSHGALVIDSMGDKTVEIGGHMWFMIVPLIRVEEMISRTNGGKPFRLYPNEQHRKWEQSLPTAVGEGTGSMYPLIMPVSEYWSTKEKQDHMRKLLANTSFAQERIMANSTSLFVANENHCIGQFEKQPNLSIEGIEDARPSFFYRRIGYMFTDDFMLYGKFNFGAFMMIQTCDREYGKTHKIGVEFPFEYGCDWKYGVNLRDVLRHEAFVGMAIVPGHTEYELEAIKSLIKHLPPQEIPSYSRSIDEIFTKEIKPYLTKFNGNAKQITKLRDNDIGNAYDIMIVYRGPEFLKYHDDFLRDIERMKFIQKAEAHLEVLTDKLVNIRLELTVKFTYEVDVNK